MNSRIKEIRIYNRMSQEDFGDSIGITKSSVSLLESGKNSPSEQTIRLICKEFNVSEDWLRTGEGEMFVRMSRSDTIAAFAGSLMKDEEESFRRRLVESLAKLDEEGWNMLEKIATDVLKRD